MQESDRQPLSTADEDLKLSLGFLDSKKSGEKTAGSKMSGQLAVCAFMLHAYAYLLSHFSV